MHLDRETTTERHGVLPNNITLATYIALWIIAYGILMTKKENDSSSLQLNISSSTELIAVTKQQ